MKYWIWLQSCLFYGNRHIAAILEIFGDAKAIFDADVSQLIAANVFSKSEISRLSNKKLAKAEEIIEKCKQNGINIITYSDEQYPFMLRNIPDFPLVLYYKGAFPDFNNLPSICIVGPRECSQFGIKAAYSLSARLSRGGMIVVSGGAKGVDSAAHNGTLSEDGITVALLPCGINYDYLKANEALRGKIINCGCLVSEFPPDYPVKQGAFQIRNRLMSALTLGTVIIEAGERSGALITARCAVEQNKDVFVIPGNPTLPQYKGSNILLRDGAKPLLSAMDVFDEYVGLYNDKLDIDNAFSKPLKPISDDKEVVLYENVQTNESNREILSNVAKSIYDNAPTEAFCIDELSIFNDYNASELMIAVAELELLGFIKAVPGGRYLKII